MEHDFNKLKAASKDERVVAKAMDFLRSYWPGGKVEEAGDEYDRAGVDFIAYHPMFDMRYYIDLKYRRDSKESYIVEWWSKLPSKTIEGTVGWSLGQPGKLTTHLLWSFRGSTMVLMDYHKYVAIVRKNARDWRRSFQVHVQTTVTQTHSWQSEFSFVTPLAVQDAIIQRVHRP